MAKRKLPKNVRERDGKYYYRYDITDPTTGKRKQKETKGFATPRDAEREGIRIQAELLHGTYIEEQDITFSSWADRWLKIYASTGKVKERTVEIRMENLRYGRKAFGGMKLRDITKLQYQTFLDQMKTGGYAENTIRLVHDGYMQLFDTAVELELIKKSPAEKAELPTFRQTVEQLESEEELPKYLEKEELALLLRTAKESGDVQGYHGLFVLAYTGMRIGELCALISDRRNGRQSSDIDEINRRISITKTLYDRHGMSVFRLDTPKTRSSVRKIDVSETVIKMLRLQATWRKEFRMSRADLYYPKEEFVFVGEKEYPGWPSPARRFEDFMKAMLEKADLPTTLTPHSLRHTYTSLMAEAGVELPAIQRLLGHRNDRVTERIYLHVTKAKKREAVEKLDKLMDSIL